ncbi:AAA family ATPase [Gordonia sp. HNM0687]|uniref:AAA family ATPase n=1 Tax=Gordonia mangrovi TaxID=2665643 RepID=A0A6L7GKG1_9ACTN|nr:AAA family ATPase [Gordonia mangrovi]MXP19897.1 AAA family ATPase [Gordonia mangrovi]UVF79481.1 AAA family ATPase [Gordonia mangrovi]
MTQQQSTDIDGSVWLDEAGVLDPHLPTRRVDTHAAVVVLNGDRAWKFKRPVRFSYLDFSTPDRRHDALEAELRLNRRTAPRLYRGLHAVRRDTDGSVSLDGPGETVDWVLEMTRFDDDALLIRCAETGHLDAQLLRSLAESVVALHASAEVCTDEAGAARLRDVVDGNVVSMAAYPEILDQARAAELTERLRTLIDRDTDLLDRRARAGRVRHGHGDLHLANIAILDGQPVPFDCLEFDAELATTDVLYDLAFLLMDLWARGLRTEANIVVNSYLDLSPDDEDAYRLLPTMLSVRATVRAHVEAAEGHADTARHYLDLALGVLDAVPARLIAFGGGSGTGKSTWARAVGGLVGQAPGARILRSDVLRKRLAGVPLFTRLPEAAYRTETSRRVYAEINRLAVPLLRGGMSAIADAVYARDDDRAAIAGVATAAGVGFTGIWLELSESERIARVAARTADPSDADATIVRRQSPSLPTPADWTVVDAGPAPDPTRVL